MSFIMDIFGGLVQVPHPFGSTSGVLFGPIGAQVPVIDIHDSHLTMHDVFTQNRQHTQALYTNLPQTITDFINNTHIKFNDRVKDTFIWQHNTNGTYTAKSGYTWLLESSNPTAIPTTMSSWSWIWKLKIPEKFKLLIWLACHNAVPTLSLLLHCHIAPSATCSRCGEDDETLMHCLRDCNYSKIIWTNLSYIAKDFFDETAHNWLRNNATNTQSSLQASGGRGDTVIRCVSVMLYGP